MKKKKNIFCVNLWRSQSYWITFWCRSSMTSFLALPLNSAGVWLKHQHAPGDRRQTQSSTSEAAVQRGSRWRHEQVLKPLQRFEVLTVIINYSLLKPEKQTNNFITAGEKPRARNNIQSGGKILQHKNLTSSYQRQHRGAYSIPANI